MPKVTADHFRALGARQFRDGEPPPADTGTWQSRARLAGWDEAHGQASIAAPLVPNPQSGWCDGCTPDECPGCGNVMQAMTAQESNQSTQPVRGSFILADVNFAEMETKAIAAGVADGTLVASPVDGYLMHCDRASHEYMAAAPCAYLRRSPLGWVVRCARSEFPLTQSIKRKTHARNVAARMGYQIVDEPA